MGHSIDNPLCIDCQSLIKAHRRVKPHNNLALISTAKTNSMFGAVNEFNYICKKCGKTWLHETGSYGEGWI